jgi:hypothetical protein
MSKATMNPGPVTLDVVGLELNAEDRRRILHSLTGGVILFGRNFTNRQQLTKLTASIKKLRPDVLISIDHEGGRVQRAKSDGFTHLPAMRKLGELWVLRINRITQPNLLLLRWLQQPLVVTYLQLSCVPVALTSVLPRFLTWILVVAVSLAIDLLVATHKLSLR